MKTAKHFMIYNITSDFYYFNQIFDSEDEAEETAKCVVHKKDKYEIRAYLHDKEIKDMIDEMIEKTGYKNEPFINGKITALTELRGKL